MQILNVLNLNTHEFYSHIHAHDVLTLHTKYYTLANSYSSLALSLSYSSCLDTLVCVLSWPTAVSSSALNCWGFIFFSLIYSRQERKREINMCKDWVLKEKWEEAEVNNVHKNRKMYHQRIDTHPIMSLSRKQCRPQILASWGHTSLTNTQFINQ